MTELRRITAILFGVSVVLMGNGLLGSLLGVRASAAGFGALTVGVMMSAYFVGFIVGAVGTVRTVELVGHIRTFSVLASVGSVVIIVHGLTLSAWSWTLLRFLGGYCVVGLCVVIESWLNGEATPRNRGTVFAMYMACTLLALGAGQYLLLVDDGERFLSFGLASILFSLGLVPVALTDVEEPPRIRVPQFALLRLWREAPLAVATVFAVGVATSAFWGMGAVFAQAAGFDSLGIAAFMSSVIFGGVVLQLPIGRWSDRTDRRVVLLGSCLGASLAAVAARIALPFGGVAFLGLAALYGGFAFSIYGLAVAHAVDRMDRERVLPATSGLLRVFGLGAILGPLLGGATIQVAGAGAFLLLLAGIHLPLVAYATSRVARRAAPAEVDRGEWVPMARTSPVALQMHPEGATVEDEEAALDEDRPFTTV